MSATPTGPIKVEFAIMVDEGQLPKLMQAMQKATSTTGAYNQAMAKIAADSQKAGGGITALTGGLNQFNTTTGKTISILNSLGQSVNSSISNMGALSGAVSKIGNAGAPVKVVSGQLQMLGSSAHTTTSKLQSMGTALEANVGSFSLAAISVFSLYNAMQNLERLELQTERVTVNAERLRNTLTIATQRYEKALASGKLTESQAEAQAQRLNIMHERSAVASAIAKHAAEELNAAYIGFSTQVLPMLIVAGGSVISMFKDMNIGMSSIRGGISAFKDVIGDIPKLAKMGITGAGSALGGLGGGGAAASAASAKLITQASNEATVALQALNTGMKSGVTSASELAIAQIQSAASTGVLNAELLEQKLIQGGLLPAQAKDIAMTLASIPAKGAAAEANMALTASTKALGSSLISLLSNPVILAGTAAIMILVGVAGAFATNMWGMRDALGGVGKAIGDFVPGLRPILEGLGWAADKIAEIIGMTSGDKVKPNVAVFGAFQEAAKGMKGATEEVVAGVEDMSDSVSGSTATMASATAINFGEMERVWKESKLELNKTSDLSPFKEVPDDIRKAWNEKIPALKNVMIEAMQDVKLKAGSKLVDLKDFVANKIAELEKTTVHGTSGKEEDKALLDRLKGIKSGLQLVQDEAGNYVVTMGTMGAATVQAGATVEDLEKANLANTAAVNGATGSFKVLDASGQQVIMTGKELTLVWQQAFDTFSKNTLDDFNLSIDDLNANQQSMGKIAEQMWPSIAAKIGDPSIPENIDNMVTQLENFKEKHKELGPLIDEIIAKTKRYGEVNFDPLISGITEARKEFNGMLNDIQKNIAKEAELFSMAKQRTGLSVPQGFGQTSGNVLKEAENQLNARPLTEGLTQLNDVMSKTINQIRATKNEIEEGERMWAAMTDATYNEIIADQEFISTHINVKKILDGSRESIIAYNQAKIDGKQAAADLIESTILHTIQINAEKDALIEADGAFDTHNGMIQDSIANIEARTAAIHGSKEEQDAWLKIQNDSIATFDIEAKASQDLTKALFDVVVAAGGMNDQAVQLQNLMNQGASATNTLTIAEANLAAQTMQTRATLGTLGPTAAQSAVGAAQGMSMAEQFIRGMGQTAASTTAEVKYYIDYLAAYGINALKVLKSMNQAITIPNLKMLVGGLFGNMPDIQQINTNIQQVQDKQRKAADKASKDSQKQKIDEKKIREDAVQQAIKEVALYSSVISKNIDETKAIRDLALEFGVAESALKKYNKQMTEFGTVTDKAQISMLKLTLAQAENLKYLHSQTQATKDLLNAQIDGAKAARDFELDTRKNAIAGKEEQKVLMDITKQLGISLPASIKPTVENLHLLIEAAYGSEEALKTLQTTVDKVADFFRDSIEDAKSAIRDGHFSDFVKRELLFSAGADEFTSKIQIKVETAVKMEDIAEQMKKQLSLINMSPELFNQSMKDSDVKAGVQTTLDSIKEAISHDPTLAKQWQPIVDGLTSVLSAPDASEALVAFAKKFPDLLGPALTGVTLGIKDLDVTMNKTLKDDGKESSEILKKGLDDVDKSADKIEKTLLKAAKAAQSANKSMSDLGGSMANLNKIPKFLVDPQKKLEEMRKKAQELKDMTHLANTDLATLWETAGQNPKVGGVVKTQPPLKDTTEFKGDTGGGILNTIKTQAAETHKAVTGVNIAVGGLNPVWDTAKTNATTAFDGIKTSIGQVATNIDNAKSPIEKAWAAITGALKLNGELQGFVIGNLFGGAVWNGLNTVWGGVQAANKWIEDNLVTPIATFDWSGAVNSTLKLGQQLLSELTIGVGDLGVWLNEHLVTPITTYPWAAKIEMVAGWGKIFVDTIGGGILTATDWIGTNIVTPIVNYPWAASIDGVKVWGQQTIGVIQSGVTDATSWINTYIVSPIINFNWKGAIDSTKAWGQQTVDVIGGAITNATGWINTNIVTPVTTFNWKGAVDTVKLWGQQTVENIKGGVTDPIGWIKTNIVTPVTKYPWKTNIDSIKQWGADMLAVIATGITNLTTWVTTNITSKLTPVDFKSKIDGLKKWGGDIMKTISDGLPDMGTWVSEHITGPIKNAVDKAWEFITTGKISDKSSIEIATPEIKSETPKPQAQSALPSPASLAPKTTGQDLSGWQKAARDSMNQVRAEFDDLVNDVRVIFTKDLASATTFAFDGIKDTPATGFKTVRGYFDALVSDVNSIFKKDLVEAMKTSFGAIAPTPTKGFNEVRKHFDSLTNDTKTKFKTNLVSSMKIAFDSIGPTAVKGFNDLRKHFDNLISDIKTKFTPSLKSAIKAAFDTMATSASGGFDKLIKKFDDLPRAAKNAADGIDSAITKITNKNYEVTVTVNQRQGSVVSGASNIDEIPNKSYTLSGRSASSASFTESITPSQNSIAVFTPVKKPERVDLDRFIVSVFKAVDKIKSDVKGTRNITFKGDIIIDGKKLGQYLRQFVLDEIDNQL